MDVTEAPPRPPPTEYRAHLGIADGIAAAPLAGTLAYTAITGGAALLGEAYFGEGDAAAPLAIYGLRALPYAAIASGVGFVTFAPVVHLLHARPAAAAASFGARAGLPALGALLMYGMVQATTPTDGQDHVAPGWEGAVAGTFVLTGAIAAALLIDYRLLASGPSADFHQRN